MPEYTAGPHGHKPEARKMKRPRLPTRGAVMHYQEVTLSSVNSGLLIWPSAVLPCLSLPVL